MDAADWLRGRSGVALAGEPIRLAPPAP